MAEMMAGPAGPALGDDMNNPKVSAALSAIAAIYFGHSIFFSAEAPSPTLSAINWFFFVLALAGFAGSMVKLAKGS